MIRQMSHFIYCHKKIAEHFSQLHSTETLLLHFWRVVLISVNDLSLVIVSHDKTPSHPEDLGEVTRQLLGWSWKQVESASATDQHCFLQRSSKYTPGNSRKVRGR